MMKKEKTGRNEYSFCGVIFHHGFHLENHSLFSIVKSSLSVISLFTQVASLECI